MQTDRVTASIRDLIANIPLGWPHGVVDYLAADAILAHPTIAEILNWAALWADVYGPPDLFPEVRALLADWRE